MRKNVENHALSQKILCLIFQVSRKENILCRSELVVRESIGFREEFIQVWEEPSVDMVRLKDVTLG